MSNPGEVIRVEVDNGAKLADLQAAISSYIQQFSGPVLVSLNKKVCSMETRVLRGNLQALIWCASFCFAGTGFREP